VSAEGDPADGGHVIAMAMVVAVTTAALAPAFNFQRAFQLPGGASSHPRALFEICGHHVGVEEPDMRQEVTAAWFFVWVNRRGGILSLDQALLGQAMAAADQR